jgi:predicted nucleic acid-binding protein
VLTGTPRLHVAESPAAYAKRPRVVADASVVIALLFEERQWEEAAERLRGRLISAPHLLDLEFANAALRKMRREGRDAAAVDRAMQVFDELVAAAAALELAQRYGLTPYDAAYLWLAERLEAPLVTFDARLGEAARRHLEGGPEGS